jgi:tetratricopeptide (TPR) repeat protein
MPALGSQRINFTHGSQLALRMTPEPPTHRKYVRIRAPEGMWVTWKSGRQTSTSRAEIMGLGGFYLRAKNPPSEGSTIELIFDLPNGQICGRGIVRNSTPGRGMGVQFVQMKPEDRATLNRFLSRQKISQEVSQEDPTVASAANSRPAKSRPTNSHPANSQLAISYGGEKAAQLRFEREVRQLIELTGKATYYQLLGVTSESTDSQIKRSYYSLARKFHPDSHMGKRELSTPLKDLMVVISEAYKTLGHEEKRAAYDKSLGAMGGFSMHRERTGAAESIEEWLKHAKGCLRANNFVGSIVWLRKCAEAAPENASYHAMLARSLGTLPRYHDEAIEHFQKAIDLDPWREPVYVQFAELLEKMQLPGRTRDVYSKLLEINPLHAKACERLAAMKAEERSEKPPALISRLFGTKS